MEVIGSLILPVSGLAAYLDNLWDMVGSCQFQTTLYNLRIVVKMAQKQASDFLEAIGRITMPVSGLVAYLDHLWDMLSISRFQPTSFDLRIVVETAQKPALRLFWKLLRA